jgi:hypothetical protein
METINSLANRHFITIVDDSRVNSQALPGSPISLKAFKNWIVEAENTSTMDLKEAKAKWASKRKQLQRLSQ